MALAARWLRIAMVVAAVATLAACGGGNDHPKMPPAEVGAIVVKPRPLALALEYPAQLRGVREVEVRARVEGILLERRYEPGARVKDYMEIGRASCRERV